MIFDVGVRVGYNESGKAICRYFRVRDNMLSEILRKTQDEGQYIFSVIPLFRKREESIGSYREIEVEEVQEEKDIEL